MNTQPRLLTLRFAHPFQANLLARDHYALLSQLADLSVPEIVTVTSAAGLKPSVVPMPALGSDVHLLTIYSNNVPVQLALYTHEKDRVVH